MYVRIHETCHEWLLTYIYVYMYLLIYIYMFSAVLSSRKDKKRSSCYNVSGLFHSIIYLSNKWLWRMSFFALLARASRGRSKLFVSLQLGLQIRMSLPAWRPVEPLFLSTGRLLYIIWKLGPLITSLCWAIDQSATTTSAASCAAGKKWRKQSNIWYDSQA